MIFRKVIPGSTSKLTIVDHNETYGRYILDKIVKNIEILKCVDIGCGDGSDLSIVKKYHPNAELFGIDFSLCNSDKLKSLGINPISLNIENSKLPFEDESIDFIIANQVLEHTKEIFWINHEVFRCLKVNGVFFMGVPNLLSLHNRILMTLGFHPTANKLTSAHVRVFSKRDTVLFYRHIGNSFCSLEDFYGSQFYPFPKTIARFLSKLFPTMAFSSFYLIRKINNYKGEFIGWPKHAQLETNYFTGQIEKHEE
ncbi:MAG: class I SAM-dependent methyltransferase [Bacteroidales bacterium]|nr:class I SAM-dependent methyltransferase [Bacteroidales bacterium]